MNRYATQGALIVQRLKQKPLTYLQMQSLGVSTSPQKRVVEWLRLHPGWRLDKPKRPDGLVQWRVVKA